LLGILSLSLSVVSNTSIKLCAFHYFHFLLWDLSTMAIDV